MCKMNSFSEGSSTFTMGTLVWLSVKAVPCDSAVLDSFGNLWDILKRNAILGTA